ncbi:MAG: (Fe-S)-binding protein [Bryobacteraceae bacterium]
MDTPTPLEVAVLAALLLVSMAVFWRRFGPVVRNIRSARSDPTFQVAPISKRVRDFFWEVMLQGKVIKERPLPGIAHALVFWGFCAFALVTIDHVAAGFGARLLSRDGFGCVYFFLAALFAVAVTVSIVGLTIRRYLVRPKWLEPVTMESAVIAFLITVLMLTYLADYLWHDAPGARGVWWAHTLALAVFLPFIPKTKHLHLILSPVTVFLRRGSFSRIAPLVGDEDFGLDTGRDVTRIDALQVYSCVECGRCTEHCPAYNTGKVLNPKQIALGMRAYLKEFGPQSSEPLIGKHISQEAVFQCTTCGACEYQCPVAVEHVPIIVGLRRGAVNTGKWEDEYGTKLFLNLERTGNPLGMSSSERDRFIQKHEFPIYDGTQEYCLWLGCMGAYDPGGREIVLSMTRLLDHLGVSWGVLRKERCTGDSARRLGNDLAFQQLAEANIEQMRSSNVRKLLSICPHCVRTIEDDWKEFGADFEIEHHSEFLARHQDKLPAAAGANRDSVVFHDPCYLGRYRNVYDEPREVIARSGSVVEPRRTRERGFCCGAGGGLAFLGEEKGKRVNVERAEELAGTGAAVVGAACPFCATMFRDALATVSPKPPKLLDIAQIAAAALPARE